MRTKDEVRRLNQARAWGEKTAERFGFASLPVCPFKIADQNEITVKAKPKEMRGVSGMLARVCDEDGIDRFGIMYATYLQNEGFERFSVAHELGHYFLEGHPEHLLPPGQDYHESHAGFMSDDPYELEADFFAAGLLMPKTLCDHELRRFKDGMAAVVGLADVAKTSLESTAICYGQIASGATAVIVSEGDTIQYGFLSETLREAREIKYPRKGAKLPAELLTIDYNRNGAKVKAGLRDRGKIDLSDWFGGAEAEGWEEIVGLGNYGKTLTVITCSDYPEEDESDREISYLYR